MTDNPLALTPEQWQRLAAARQAYTDTVSPYYDETLQEVTRRACTSGSIGKADIGALLMWKRLRADTPWVAELMALADTDVRRATAAATTAAQDTMRFPRCAVGADQLVRAGWRVFRFVGSAVACLV
ncbi:hypothetical protein [Streptomyces scabiei]|uniref:hypothetical protein n=1 Tax=Streptomyces scabiei TaxID=1930 RepID=UPI0029B854EB|nr:hypothetical protein [Streptomyces scabiei]MDX3524860.1 hypothetical protein [Streptomyces scabiei]